MHKLDQSLKGFSVRQVLKIWLKTKIKENSYAEYYEYWSQFNNRE